MSYSPAVLYDLNGNFVGYVILSENKLQGTNIWQEAEKESFNQRLNQLNASNNIKAFWPHPQDPVVQQLLADPNFHPIEMAESQTIDRDKSYLVYEQIERRDINGEPTGEFEDGDILENESVIKYKPIQVPKNPSDMKLRLQDAMETVARQRLEASS